MKHFIIYFILGKYGENQNVNIIIINNNKMDTLYEFNIFIVLYYFS